MPTIIEHGKSSYTYDSQALVAALPPFGRVFKRYKPPGALAGVLEILDGDLVRMVPIEDVRDAIIAWARQPHMPGTRREVMEILFSSVLDAADAMKQATNWIASFTEDALTELPPAVRVKSEPGRCFSRLPFDIDKQARIEDAPTWAGMLARMTNSEAFAMRYGSILDHGADRKQALWLWGDRDSGKSTMIELLRDVIGQNSYNGIEYSDTANSFFKFTLVGKRICYINECSVDFLTQDNSPFKGLTGDSFHLVNRKGRDHFMARLDVLMFMTSNPEPRPKEAAVVERLIACRMRKVPDDEHIPAPVLKQRLIDEMPVFLSWSHSLYLEKRLPSGRIPCDKSRLYEHVELNKSDALDFLSHNFHTDRPKSHVTVARMDEILKREGKFIQGKVKTEWEDAWESEAKVMKAKRRWKTHDLPRWGYWGIEERKDRAFVPGTVD
jgi:hypothetical protein